MRALLVSALLLSFVTLAPAALAAEAAPCSGGLCDVINKVCGNCIPMASADCPGELCDVINVVCWVAFGEMCVY